MEGKYDYLDQTVALVGRGKLELRGRTAKGWKNF